MRFEAGLVFQADDPHVTAWKEGRPIDQTYLDTSPTTGIEMSVNITPM
jgi:hypothetical protein